MKLDLTSIAFGFAINGSNGNPNWATALGQGYLHKINQSDSINEILKGLLYCSVPLDCVQTKIGKGGKVYKGTDPESGIITGSVFNKVYVNGNLVPDCKVIIVLTKDTTPSHEGRLRLKYSPHNAILNEQGDVTLSNADQIEKIRTALNLTPNACWFVYEIEVVGQDALYLSAGIADSRANVSYASTSDLHDKWNDIIVAAGGSPIKLPEGDGAYQLITYGAPGTGKSHKIDELTNETNSIRVTFHPDTDYATFVGCYKPTMLPNVQNKILNKDELINELLLLKQGEVYPCQKFGFKFYNSLQNLNKSKLIEILKKCGFTKNMTTEIDKAKSVALFAQLSEKNDIVYEFVPQAFMKAYVEAWRRYTNAELKDSEKNYYLVIEEINRGNCAQIFGDLFQLLDRADNGFSSYAITPDNDIQNFLQTDKKYKLAEISLYKDIEKQTKSGVKVIATAADIKMGKKLVLPPNLYIWATMNTSDQSLFPMDSAFKRRWDWEYVPIKDMKKGWKIKFGDCEVDWWKFLVAINKIVKSVTNSADKQMGYFFVKAKDSVIDAEMFVNKVAFYLWNDVFKDCELDGDAFKITREGDEVDVLTFQDFFNEDGDVNEVVLKDFLTNLVPESKPENDATTQTGTEA